MAGGQDHSKFQRGVITRYYENIDTIALQRLAEIVSDLYLAEGGQATKLWNSARQALAKLAPADDPHVMKVLSIRSIPGLAKLVTELQSGARASAASAQVRAETPAQAPGGNPVPPSGQLTHGSASATADPVVGDRPMTPPLPPRVASTAAVSSSSTPITPDQLKHAMKAFRKRLKLTKLDEESKLGRTGNPMSGGKKSQVVAIMAPREYPQAVWDELVKQGKLKPSGGSFYELAEGA